MPHVSTLRLNLLRATYALVLVGLAVFVWPGFIARAPQMPHMQGVVCAMLIAVSLLSALGLRHPLRMLPVLLFELAWKTLWMAFVAFPLWRDGKLEGAFAATVSDNLLGLAIFPFVIPWKYVYATYLRGRGEAWRSPAAPAPGTPQ